MAGYSPGSFKGTIPLIIDYRLSTTGRHLDLGHPEVADDADDLRQTPVKSEPSGGTTHEDLISVPIRDANCGELVRLHLTRLVPDRN